MKKMKYLCYYNNSSNECRSVSPAAFNKINYIVDVLEKLDYCVEIISPAYATKTGAVYGSSVTSVSANSSCRSFFSCCSKIKILNYLYVRITFLFFFLYVFFNCKKNETILVYHSINFGILLLFLKKIKNVNIILEIEELYSNVFSNIDPNHELKIIDLASKYIMITSILNEIVNKNSKQFCICHGQYSIKPLYNIKKDNKYIDCVYSGTFDDKKGGVMMALSLAEYLPNYYRIHILGFGTDDQIKCIKDDIEIINKKNGAQVFYDGLLTGNDYDMFLQKCDIGLSTQNPDAAFNDTSFPSKILSYMANGLRVVSIKIPAVETSQVGKYIYFYNFHDSKDIANTIMNINFNDNCDSRNIIIELNSKFEKEVKEMIEDGN